TLMMNDNLYMLNTVADYSETLNVESRGTKRKIDNNNSGALWHKRLGHISQKRIERLVSDGILDSIDFTDHKVIFGTRTFWTLQVDDVCKSEDCILY
ncbi:hypothetical protein Lal_00043221, partial [Lupinus albus]